eukprot:7644238-Pyramimonas_sp.AAC.1
MGVYRWRRLLMLLFCAGELQQEGWPSRSMPPVRRRCRALLLLSPPAYPLVRCRAMRAMEVLALAPPPARGGC